jgi:hypothetical protein
MSSLQSTVELLETNIEKNQKIWNKKELEYEDELLLLFDENEKLKKIENEVRDSENEFLHRGQLVKKISLLQKDYEDLQIAMVQSQGVNLDIINDLNTKLDENAYTMAQLKLGGGSVGKTKIGAIGKSFANSSIGKLLKLDKKDDKGAGGKPGGLFGGGGKAKSVVVAKTKEEKKENVKKGLGALFGMGSTKGSRSATPIKSTKGGKSTGKTKKSVTIAESEILDDEMDKMSFSPEKNRSSKKKDNNMSGFMTK